MIFFFRFCQFAYIIWFQLKRNPWRITTKGSFWFKSPISIATHPNFGEVEPGFRCSNRKIFLQKEEKSPNFSLEINVMISWQSPYKVNLGGVFVRFQHFNSSMSGKDVFRYFSSYQLVSTPPNYSEHLHITAIFRSNVTEAFGTKGEAVDFEVGKTPVFALFFVVDPRTFSVRSEKLESMKSL